MATGFLSDVSGIGARERMGGWSTFTLGALSVLDKNVVVFSDTTIVCSGKEVSRAIFARSWSRRDGEAGKENIIDEQLRKGD